jgi:CRP-like cAMP-binding protein
VNVEDSLQNVTLFRQMKPKEIKSLSKWTTTRHFQPGQVIVAQGQSGVGLYCIQSGKVKVTQKTAHGEREIRTMSSGESFGELSLLDNQPRGATVTALEPTTAVLLEKTQFLAEMRTHPEIALAMVPVLVHWVRQADEKIAELS